MAHPAEKSGVPLRSSRPRLPALGFVVVASLSPLAASASELDAESPSSPPTPRYPLELGARAGYGTAPIRGAVNPFGAGFGARVGYVVSDVYFGARATYYLGGSDVGASDQALLFGGAVGYGFHLGELLVLRPSLGVGDVAVAHTEPLATVDVVTTASGSTSRRSSITTTVNNVYVEPGLTLMLASGAHFVAVNGSALVVPGITYGPAPAQSTTWLSYALEGDIGFRF